ncbi:hypothetical protein QVD99_003237 [Batrachochytrium dendrobatidis]|nr:hypothetical protein QVD99_003237 [Batrachochytrium dendrobatidis]
MAQPILQSHILQLDDNDSNTVTMTVSSLCKTTANKNRDSDKTALTGVCRVCRFNQHMAILLRLWLYNSIHMAMYDNCQTACNNRVFKCWVKSNNDQNYTI